MNSSKEPLTAAEVERDIMATRDRLSHGLAALDREYALRNLFVHAVRMAGQGRGAPAFAPIVKRNALPLGLVGIGVAWMAFANSDIAGGRRLRDAVKLAWGVLEAAANRHGTPDDLGDATKFDRDGAGIVKIIDRERLE